MSDHTTARPPEEPPGAPDRLDVLRPFALTAVSTALSQHDEWLRLGVRQAIGNAVVDAVFGALLGGVAPKPPADAVGVALTRLAHGNALRIRIADALRAAAHDCPGDCGLSEETCRTVHPIQVAMLVNGRATDVTAPIDDIAVVIAAALSGPGACSGTETVPNTCACPCEGCKHHCAAHRPPPAARCERHPTALRIGDMCGMCTQYGELL